jgi:multiple sugar transport system permease protein
VRQAVARPLVAGRPRPSALRLGRLALYGVLLLLSAAFLLPAAWMVSSSFKPSTDIFVHPIRWIPEHPILTNYRDAFSVQPLARFALNTGIVVFAAVLGTTLSSASVAFSFARLRWPGRDFLFSLLLASMMLPEVVTLIPKFVLFRQLGWLGTFLPLTVPYWFGGTPFFVFLLRQFFRGLPYELDEAARMDGASSLRILMQVMIPLAKPALATVVVFSMLANYNDFLHALIYLNRQDNWTLALGIRAFNDSYTAKWELIFAAATVMVAPMVALFFVAQRYFVQGIQFTGLAGR